MGHTLPDTRTKQHRGRLGWALTLGAACAGLGLGLAIAGAIEPGAALAAAGGLLYLFSRHRASQRARSEREARQDVRPVPGDPETGLPYGAQLEETLAREIARSRRYGDRTALAVFETRIARRRGEADASSPSPAPFVAATLKAAMRTADMAGRLDDDRFMVLLTESDAEGAALFAERARTMLSKAPFARRPDGSGIYLRAWAGWASWDAALTSPAAYVQAALDQLESTRHEYESQNAYFRGEVAS